MAGIGNYAKGKKFTLKSGNTPMFKHVGSSPSPITSPANMNNFGIGKGTSPLEQSYEIKRGDNCKMSFIQWKRSFYKDKICNQKNLDMWVQWM